MALNRLAGGLVFAALILLTGVPPGFATEAIAQKSPPKENPISPLWPVVNARAGCLLEMFTSDFCAYCQQAESWLSKNKERLNAPVFLAAYHVDTFDTPTQTDAYASKQLTDRHKAYRMLGAIDFIATPQFFYNGVELKNWKEALNRGCEKAANPLGLQSQVEFKAIKDKARLSATIQTVESLPAYNVKIHVALVEHLPNGKSVVRFLSSSLDVNPAGKSVLKESFFSVTPHARYEVLVFAQNIHTLKVIETWSLAVKAPQTPQ